MPKNTISALGMNAFWIVTLGEFKSTMDQNKSFLFNDLAEILGAVSELSPIFAAAATFAGLGALTGMIWQRSSKGGIALFLIFLAFSCIGVSIGFLAGHSRTGVVGNVLPAALVFLGAGATYLFSYRPEHSPLTTLGVLVFTLSMLVMYFGSAGERSKSEFIYNDYVATRDECLNLILSPEFLEYPKVEKVRVRAYCKDYVTFLR